LAVETAYPGVGLTRLDGQLQHEWAQSAAEYHVDLTIVMLGAWDLAWEQEHGAAAYRALIERSLASFSRAHGKVLWLAALPGGGKQDRTLDPFYAALPAQHPGQVEYLDIAPAMQAPDGSTPRVVGGRVLRQLDGWHLCQDGAVAIAHAALGRLGLDSTGWEPGPWRGDARYRPASEGCPG
jgi:lysophospholipase L1-like esterase